MKHCGIVIEFGCEIPGSCILVPPDLLYEAEEICKQQGKSFSYRRIYSDEVPMAKPMILDARCTGFARTNEALENILTLEEWRNKYNKLDK